MREGGVTFGSLSRTSGASTLEQKETPHVKEKTTESVEASSPPWQTLDAFARHSLQQLLQQLLEEEVDGLLGRGRYERRAGVDAPVGYRNGLGTPRRLTLSSGAIT